MLSRHNRLWKDFIDYVPEIIFLNNIHSRMVAWKVVIVIRRHDESPPTLGRTPHVTHVYIRKSISAALQLNPKKSLTELVFRQVYYMIYYTTFHYTPSRKRAEGTYIAPRVLYQLLMTSTTTHHHARLETPSSLCLPDSLARARTQLLWPRSCTSWSYTCDGMQRGESSSMEHYDGDTLRVGSGQHATAIVPSKILTWGTVYILKINTFHQFLLIPSHSQNGFAISYTRDDSALISLARPIVAFHPKKFRGW